MKRILLYILLGFFFFLINDNIYAQKEIGFSKHKIKTIFRHNYKGTTHNWKRIRWAKSYNRVHKDIYKYWTACNKDSSYYYSDTLILYNYDYFAKCYPQIQWFFVGKGTIKYVIPNFRRTVSASTHKIKVKKKGDRVIIEIFKDKAFSKEKEKPNLMERFLVLSLRKEYHKGNRDNPMYVIVLKRIPPNSLSSNLVWFYPSSQ